MYGHAVCRSAATLPIDLYLRCCRLSVSAPASPTLLTRFLLLSVVATGCVAPPPGTVDPTTGAVLDICASAPDGALCEDDNACTTADTCMGGLCIGVPAPDGTLCTDGNVCTTGDVCSAGTCVGTPRPDNTPCTDGDPCTVGDQCSGGRCQPGSGRLVCDDSIACTSDVCTAGLGCVFMPNGDCPADGGDGPAEAPATSTDGPGQPETGPPGDGPSPEDALVTEGGADGGGEDGGGADGLADAPINQDGSVQDGSAAGDAGLPADGAQVTTDAGPQLHAKGGACSCDAGRGSGGDTAATLVLLGTWAVARRRVMGNRRGSRSLARRS